MGKISRIVLHCSDSHWGTAVEIDKWHRERGWNRIGYLGVILNGYPLKDVYWEFCDGAWEWGRPCDKNNIIEPQEMESHAFGINETSVGICLIGTKHFSVKQFLSARKILRYLCSVWDLTYKDVIGHCEVKSSGKTCPNIDMDLFRSFMVDYNLVDDLIRR